MPYSAGSRLPGETASKLGHLSVVQSAWVRALVNAFEESEPLERDPAETQWKPIDSAAIPLRSVWAVDGSFVAVRSEQKPPKEVAFVKAALVLVDRAKLDAIDKENPHPLLLQDVLRDSAVYHSTVFPLKNVRTSLGSNYDAVRHIVKDSLKVDESGAFYDTLSWLAYSKWSTSPTSSPAFECPHCNELIAAGLPFDSDEMPCAACGATVFLSDLLGFHLDMDEESAPDSVASSYMLVMEHLMLFTAIRLLWGHTDPSLVGETLFVKDGPLTLRSQYSKLVPRIREFLQHAKDSGRPIHVIGQEKTGAFVDHLQSIVRFAAPHSRDEPGTFSVLDHDYVRREVYRSPDLANPYGKRTNWGEKVFVKLDPGMSLVINVPTGAYLDASDRPNDEDLMGIRRILATLPSLASHKFEGALFPVELANGIASMSSYPSATILRRFVDAQER